MEIHQAAYNTLTELNEGVPETKKVTDFLAGITDPRLATAKDLILGDTAKLGDFEACQQFLKNVSGLQTNSPKGGGKRQEGKRKRIGSDKSNANDVTTHSYTREEWQKLSMEQRDKIRALRTARRNKAIDKPMGRNASSLTLQEGGNAIQDAEASEGTHETVGSRAQPTSGNGGRR